MWRILAILAGVCGAVSLSQFPEFSQQYLQRLAGKVDVLTEVAAGFDATAARNGLDREGALAALTGSPILTDQQADMRALLAEQVVLAENLAELRAAGPLERLTMPQRFGDMETLQATWADFRPALPATTEGAITAGVGYVGGWALVGLLGQMLGLAFRRRRAVPRDRGLTGARTARMVREKERAAMATTAPFSRFEVMIAWRYLRSRRAEGGVSVMTWISLIGITLAVFALIATMAVRAGFRAEFVDTILGANAHVTVYSAGQMDEAGNLVRAFADYDSIEGRLLAIPGVTRAAPLIKGQVMATLGQETLGAEVYGMRAADLATIPRIGAGSGALGDLAAYDNGIAMGSQLARELGVGLGDRVRLISPSGVKTALGTSPRVNAYTVVYIFTAGRYDIDRTRIYMPFAEAQSYFNKDGLTDEFEVMVADPDTVDAYTEALLEAGGPEALIWTWRDSSGSFLRALTVEDNVMFVIMSILVLIAAMNIVSGLIMLVKNKGRDIGILRTMGLTEGSILRIFFLCGAFTGILGTLFGVVLGCLFAVYIDPIFSLVNYWSGGGVWDPSIRGIYNLPAKLMPQDVLSAVALSLGLSFVVTIFPARRAARMNPVEALRYE